MARLGTQRRALAEAPSLAFASALPWPDASLEPALDCNDIVIKMGQ